MVENTQPLVMLKKIMNKEIYIFLFITLIFFGVFIKLNFSVDTYLLFASKDMNYIHEFFSSGRILTTGLFIIFKMLRLNYQTMYFISFVLATFFTTVSLYQLNETLKKYINNYIISIIISTVIIINAFIIELWLFIEMSIMMLSILGCVMAFKNFDSFLESKNREKLLYTILWLLLSLFSYQGTVALFVVLSALSILKHSNNKKGFLTNNLLLLICYGIPTFINFVFIKIIGNNRVGGTYNFIDNFKYVVNVSKEQLFNGFGLYPKGIFPLLIFISVIMIIIMLLLENKQFISKIKSILNLFYIIVILYLFSVAPIFTQNSNELVIYPRIVYAFGSIVGIIFLFSFMNVSFIKRNNSYKKISVIVMLIALLIEFYTFTTIAINRYIVNYMDKNIVFQINEKITQYEDATGNIIEHIAVYNLNNSTKFYKDINDMINVSAKSEQPSGTALLVFYMDKKLDVVESDGDMDLCQVFRHKNLNKYYRI